MICLHAIISDMPTYEYKCEKCSKIFEEFQSINDAPIVECVFCKGSVKRVFSSVGISFKGSGFHVNDYASKPISDISTAPVESPAAAKSTTNK